MPQELRLFRELLLNINNDTIFKANLNPLGHSVFSFLTCSCCRGVWSNQRQRGQEAPRQQILCICLVSALELQRRFHVLTEAIIKFCHGPFGKERWGTLLILRSATQSQWAVISEGSCTLDGVAILSFADVPRASGASALTLYAFLSVPAWARDTSFRGLLAIP